MVNILAYRRHSRKQSTSPMCASKTAHRNKTVYVTYGAVLKGSYLTWDEYTQVNEYTYGSSPMHCE